MIKIKRIYEDYSETDGYRILIDRLWPRGISKERAKIDLWIKDIAPSNDLRKWYLVNSEKNDQFQKIPRSGKWTIKANTFLVACNASLCFCFFD